MIELKSMCCKYTNDLIYIIFTVDMKIKQHIPNAITCCNLLCGCLAIVKAFDGDLVMSAYLVGLAAIFDFFDGFAARLLRVVSPIGKDLDSLADMVTFGVVPGVIMYKLLEIGIITYNLDNNDVPLELSLIAFVITIFSAIRLAIFNNDTRQTSSFIGVPTPAVAIFICSIPLVLQNNNQYLIFINPIFLIVTSIIFSILLVSELPLFALKFKTFGWKGNRTKYIFLGLSLLLLIFLEFVGIPLIILLYIIMSLITHLYMKRKKV